MAEPTEKTEMADTQKPKPPKYKVKTFNLGLFLLAISLFLILAIAAVVTLINSKSVGGTVASIIFFCLPALAFSLWTIDLFVKILKGISELRLVEIKMICPKCGKEDVGYDEQTYPAGKVTRMATGTCNSCLTRRMRTVALLRA